MQRPVYYRYAVIAVVTVLFLQQDSAAFHATLSTTSSSGRTNPYQVPHRQKQQQQQQQQPLRSTVDNDNVMSAFDQAFAKLKGEGSPPSVNPAENLQNMKMEIVSKGVVDTAKFSSAALPNNNNTKKIWKPQPPQTDPPKDAYRQQQLLQSTRTKNAVAVAASKRTLTTASTPAPSSKVGTTQVDPKQQNKLFSFGRSTAMGENVPENGPEQSQQPQQPQPLHNLKTAEPERPETKGAAISSLASSSAAPFLDKIINKSDLATAATAAPSAVDDASVETRPKQQKPERQVVSTIGGRMTVVPESKMNISQSFATWQSWCIGAFIGVAAVTPITLLHHFYFYPTYESLAQWEYDTGAALVQGAVFAAVYRYAIREDWDEEKLGKAVFMAFFLVRSLVGIHVPMSCSTPFLFCAEPLPFADWDMVRAFAMSAAESYVLFGAVAGTMDLLLRNSVIRPFK